MKKSIKTLAVWLIMGIIFVVLISSIIDNSQNKMTYSELISKMELGEVKEIELTSDGESAYVTLEGQTIPKEVNIPNTENVCEIIKLIQPTFYSNNTLKGIDTL